MTEKYKIMNDVLCCEINGKLICDGDIHKEVNLIDGEPTESHLPVVFDNGCFWVDESFHKDGSVLTLAAEYELPLNIVGDKFNHSNLLK